MDNLNTLSRFDLFRVFLRLVFMQALLNRHGMQNLALANALAPVAGKIDTEQDKSLLSRHMDFFNCNPNFVPLIVGGLPSASSGPQNPTSDTWGSPWSTRSARLPIMEVASTATLICAAPNCRREQVASRDVFGPGLCR